MKGRGKALSELAPDIGRGGRKNRRGRWSFNSDNNAFYSVDARSEKTTLEKEGV